MTATDPSTQLPKKTVYDPNLDIWPDLRNGIIKLSPVRVGVDSKTGKVLVGWDHVVQSIGRIFATRYHSRVLRRWVGCFLPHLLGKSATEFTIPRTYWAMITALDLWEPNYRIQRVRFRQRAISPTDNNGDTEASLLTSAEELRGQGKLTSAIEGVYRPRAHVGDDTPEVRRAIGLVGRGTGVWQRAQ